MQDYSEPVWLLDTKVNEGWNVGQVKIARDYDFFLMMEVIGAELHVGQIAIDDFLTVEDGDCATMPEQANPTTPSTPVTTTTPEPTEGPQRKRISYSLSTFLNLGLHFTFVITP